MFLVASDDKFIIDSEEVGSSFKECEGMNCFKPWIRNVQSNFEKA